jgi:pyridoxal phosphate enzyme (YggS family)
MTASITENLEVVGARMNAAALACGRAADSVQLIAVSKTQPAASIRTAFAAGQRAFGENYLQEALDKMEALADLPLIWHFIGPIQSNKTRALAMHFDWVHTVDREKIARRLSEQRPPERSPLNVLLQVNLSGESSKSGVSLDELPQLAHAVAALPGLKLKGLMAIPAPETDTDRQRATFRQLAEAASRLRQSGCVDCTELSMGMSQDYPAAIAEGATLVRIGSDIFGTRPASF